MKNLATTIFISLISISFSIHSQDRKFQCEGMETQDYVINGEESWWGEWAGMKELGIKPFVLGIENEMVSMNYPFEFHCSTEFKICKTKKNNYHYRKNR